MAERNTGETKKVVVAGDVCIDWLLHNVSEKAPRNKETVIANWKNAKNSRMHVLPGGALLLRAFIKNAVKGKQK